MPKIIKNLEFKIIEVSEKLFIDKSYENIDMRMIAKEVGIAVGTLYNYYSNKRELFEKVFEKSWERTFKKLDKIIESSNSPKDKIVMFVKELYEDMESRNGMGRELLRIQLIESEKKKNNDDKNTNKNNRIKEKKYGMVGEIITQKLEMLLNEAKKLNGLNFEDGMESRIAISILLLTGNTLIEYPEEKEKNLKFINQFIEITLK